MKLTPTRSRKHPLGLTLLSENYKQLLAEFQDFQGPNRGSGSDSDGLCTPPEQHEDEQAHPGPVPSSEITPTCNSKTANSAATPAKSPRSSLNDKSSQHNPAGSAAAIAAAATTAASAAAAASRQVHGSKRPKSGKAGRTPSKKSLPTSQQQKPVGRDGKHQQQEPMPSPRQQAAAPDAGLHSPAALQKAANQHHSTAKSEQRHLQKQASKQAHPPADASTAAADAGAVSDKASSEGSSLQSSGGPAGRPAAVTSASTNAAGTGVAQPAAEQTSAVQELTAGRHAKQLQQAKPAATAVPAVQSSKQPAQQQPQPLQPLRQQQQEMREKHSRRRVGDSSQPLTGSSSSVLALASPAPAPSAAVQLKDPGPAAVARSPVELPRLPLQRLQAGGPVLLPPLHPATARGAPHSAGSTKASKSEPASARMSRRTSECNSTDGTCADISGRKSDNSAAGGSGTVRQHSLPDTTALPSNRRHSIACLVEVSRKHQQHPKAGSEGGLLPSCAESGSMLQRSQQQPLQPLQPLKQLQEIRRRTQLRAGGDENSSHDCQILILEGPPVAVSSGKQGTGNSCSSQHTAHWQAGSPASTAAAAGGGSGSEHHWPGPVDPPSAGAAHRRTRSSNTQLPPLEEHTVLSEPGLAGALQPTTTAAGAQVLTLPAAEALGLQSMGSDGLTGYHSRRSSRADSDISSGADSTAGGLVCEPSSFGVCADPAGAVHLVTPAIPDKLARLKQRLPSRLTADSAAAAVARCSIDVAGAAGLQAGTGPDSALPATSAPPAAAKPERVRSRRQWQLPAVNPPQQEPQQQQPPAAQSAAQSAAQPQQQRHQWQQQQHGQHEAHAPTRSMSCRQGKEAGKGSAADVGHQPAGSNPPAWGAHGQHVQPQSWDGSSAQRQYAKAAAAAVAAAAQQQQGANHSFMAELKRQLEHWAGWVHLHSHNPQQAPPPPQLPPQLQATIAQQEQYQHMAQQQLLQQQQYFMQQAAAAGAAAAATGIGGAGAVGGFVGPTPAHGALSRFTDPWAEKQQQRLLQHRQSVHAAAAADHAAVQHPEQGQQQGSGWQQQGSGWQQRAPQQPQAHAQEQASPSVVSASALAQQRRAMQQQAFEGLSLEAVLASAKKSKPPSKRQLLEGSSGGGQGEAVEGSSGGGQG